MTNKPETRSIAELALEKEAKVEDLACAIEMLDYYTWDQFGRIKLIPVKTENESFKAHRRVLLDELAAGYENWEFDEGYFAGTEYTAAAIRLSGWPDDQLPDFAELQKQWNNQQQLKSEAPNKPVIKHPATQSSVWKILRAALLSDRLDEEKIIKWIHTDANSHDMTKLQIALGLNGDIAEVTTDRIKEHLSKLWPK
jgi:hypothetical protein